LLIELYRLAVGFGALDEGIEFGKFVADGGLEGRHPCRVHPRAHPTAC
jgi:hypothetical protein